MQTPTKFKHPFTIIGAMLAASQIQAFEVGRVAVDDSGEMLLELGPNAMTREDKTHEVDQIAKFGDGILVVQAQAGFERWLDDKTIDELYSTLDAFVPFDASTHHGISQNRFVGSGDVSYDSKVYMLQRKQGKVTWKQFTGASSFEVNGDKVAFLVNGKKIRGYNAKDLIANYDDPRATPIQFEADVAGDGSKLITAADERGVDAELRIQIFGAKGMIGQITKDGQFQQAANDGSGQLRILSRNGRNATLERKGSDVSLKELAA